MGLTKRKDGWYVEFRVLDDGETLKLASRGGGQLKRWKLGALNKTVAKQQEAVIKTKLLTGQVISPLKEKAQSVTFRQWAQQYLELEQIKKLKSHRMRRDHVRNLVSFFLEQAVGRNYSGGCTKVSSAACGAKGSPSSDSDH